MTDAVPRATGFVEVAGAPLSYEVAGAGPTVVLLHEGIADSRMYDDQFDTLAVRHRVVRYDLHGFGRSGKPQQPYTHHEALHGLLRHLGIARAAVLGMSLGGSVAVDFALTYPDMVQALLLLATGLSGHPPSETMIALAAPMVAAFQAGDFVRAIDLSVRFWVDGPRRRPEEVDPAVRERIRQLYTEVLRRSREPGPDADPLDPPGYTRLAEIRVPTLIVVGAGDLPDILDQADLLERTIPVTRKVVLPEVAHVPNMERPAEINRVIIDFLDEHHPSESGHEVQP
jgi:pimeloyl-ACP methyl ester carboxylesterase